jgi:hypothetical protein
MAGQCAFAFAGADDTIEAVRHRSVVHREPLESR